MIPTYPFPADLYRLVGKVTSAHGIKGEIKVVFFSNELQQIQQNSRVALVATDGRMTTLLEVVGARRRGRTGILKLDTIDNRNEAELIAGMGILLPGSQHVTIQNTPGINPNQLLGMSVYVSSSNAPIGTVVDYFSNGAQSVLVVKSDTGECLIPLVPEIVLSVSTGKIVIDPPPGLLDVTTTGQ